MTQVRTQDMREKTLAFENLPQGAWVLFDDYAYIKVKPFTIKGEEETYNAIGSDGIAYSFEDEYIEPIEEISLIVER